MPYRVEVSPNKRAGCKATDCKKEAIKIDKGELRFATQVTILEKTSWAYKHWGCVTPQQIGNWQKECEGDTDLVDGYDELTPEYQEKVKRALEQGHVDDEDWKGDVELNRPGAGKGKHKKTPIKAKGKEEDTDEPESPTKPAPKKRGRAKKVEADEEEEAEAPAPKKARGRPKKTVKEEKAEEAEPEIDEEPATPAKTTKAKGRPKKTKATVAAAHDTSEGAVDEDEEKPAPAKKAGKAEKGTKAKPAPVESDLSDIEEKPVPEPPKRGRKKAAKA